MGTLGPCHAHIAKGTQELGLKFLLCKDWVDLTQEQRKKSLNLEPLLTV